MRLNVLQGKSFRNHCSSFNSTVRSHKRGFHCFSGAMGTFRNRQRVARMYTLVISREPEQQESRTRGFHQYLHSISTKRPRRLPLATRRASHASTLLLQCCIRCTVYGLGLLSRTVGTTWNSHDQHNTIGSRKGVESIGGRGCERCPAACAPPIESQSPLLKKSGHRRQKQQQEPRMREASLCRVDAWRGGRR